MAIKWPRMLKTMAFPRRKSPSVFCSLFYVFITVTSSIFFNSFWHLLSTKIIAHPRFDERRRARQPGQRISETIAKVQTRWVIAFPKTQPRIKCLRRRLFSHRHNGHLCHNCITVIAFVIHQILYLKAVDQLVSLCTICAGTFRNNGSDRPTMRIHGQMYLGVEPPFVRLMP